MFKITQQVDLMKTLTTYSWIIWKSLFTLTLIMMHLFLSVISLILTTYNYRAFLKNQSVKSTNVVKLPNTSNSSDDALRYEVLIPEKINSIEAEMYQNGQWNGQV